MNAIITKREKEIMQHLFNDKTDKEICVELGIESGTIRKHVSNVMIKINAKSRVGAVISLMKAGIVK